MAIRQPLPARFSYSSPSSEFPAWASCISHLVCTLGTWELLLPLLSSASFRVGVCCSSAPPDVGTGTLHLWLLRTMLLGSFVCRALFEHLFLFLWRCISGSGSEVKRSLNFLKNCQSPFPWPSRPLSVAPFATWLAATVLWK